MDTYGLPWHDCKREMTEHGQRSYEEKRIQSLWYGSSEAVAIMMPDGKIIYATPPVREILGYSSDELCGLTLTDLIHPVDAPDFEKMISAALVNIGIPIKGYTGRVMHIDGKLAVDRGFHHELIVRCCGQGYCT